MSAARLSIFPLPGAILFPGMQLPLHIFEPRYLAMTDHALSGGRLIGMVQPRLDGATRPDGEPALCDVGCVGRLGSVSETGDGRYLITLIGICAGTLTTLAFLPQALRAWKTRSTADVSLVMFLAMCAGIVLWLIYGLLLSDLPLIIANGVTLGLALAVLAAKLRFG